MDKLDKRSAFLPVGIYLLLCTVILLTILKMNSGHFTYSLDDPYIHLALSERIARGTYGINVGEMTSPSSSVIWPLLLAPFASQSWQPLLPLLLNFVFGTIAAWLLGAFLTRWFFKSEKSLGSVLVQIVLSILLVIAANLVGLTFVGMEHVLQIVLTIGCALGVLEAYGGRPVPGWAIAMAVLAPAVRYEDLVLTLAVTLALWFQTRRRTAILAFIGSLLPLLIFGLYLRSHGLAMLPNSVLAKGGAYSGTHNPLMNLLLTAVKNVKLYVTNRGRWSMLILAGALALLAGKNSSRPLQSKILWSCFLVVVLAILFGPYGWFYRYEIYGKLFGVMIVIAALSEMGSNGWKYATAVLFVCALPYFGATKSTPVASHEVYCQQYQMHRFLDEYYKQNVAVHDLGWVSYRADKDLYILDLYGLASQEALKQQNKDAAWLDSITRKHNIGLVMGFPELLSAVPSSWTPIGRLEFIPPRANLGVMVFPHVGFYSTGDGDPALIRSEVEEFEKTLPRDDKFVMSSTAAEVRTVAAPVLMDDTRP